MLDKIKMTNLENVFIMSNSNVEAESVLDLTLSRERYVPFYKGVDPLLRVEDVK